MPRIDVNADAFRIVSAFISSEETRYYLCGVYIHPHPCGGAVMVATDGHRLFAFYDRTGKADSGYILAPSKAIMKATKRTKDDKPGRRRDGINSLRLQWDGATVTIATEAGDIRATEKLRAIDGTFPDYKRVIPAKVSATEGGRIPSFNAGYIADFEAAGRDLIDSGLSECRAAYIALASNDDSGPALVTINNHPDICAALMPVRGDAMTEPPAFWNARPFHKPRYRVCAPKEVHTYGGDRWKLAVSSQTSDIAEPKARDLFFATRAEAERAYNRIIAGLARSGIENLPERIGPVYHFSAEQLAERERRLQAVQAAREVFETATEEDLRDPWQMERIKPEAHDAHHACYRRAKAIHQGRSWTSLRDAALNGLPHVSQARAMAALYKVAA